MKTRFLIFTLLITICLVCSLVITVIPIQGLPGFLNCTYDSNFVISVNKLEFVPDETFVLNTKTTQNDDVFEIIIIDPKEKEVFADVLDVHKNDYSQIRFHIPDNAQRGTWSVFVNARTSAQQEVIFFGVDEPPQSTLVIKPSSVNYEYKVDDASFLVAGKPNTDIQVNVLDHDDKIMHVYIVKIPSEDKCSFILDLDEYKPSVYAVEISDHTDHATAVFTVGLEPTTGVIAIRTDSDSYFSGDKVSVLGDTAPNLSLTIDVVDPFENAVDQFSVVSGNLGAINTSFNLPMDAKNGTWTVRATSDPNFDSMEFNVIQKPLAGQHESLVPIPEPEEDKSVYANCGPETTLQDGICVVDKTKENATDTSVRWGGPVYNYVEPPLKQIKSGVSLDKIECKENLFLIQKYDGSPACIKPETFSVLYLRGWGDCVWNCSHIITDGMIEPEPVINEDGTISENTNPYTLYDITGLKQIYKLGESISFTETVQGYDNPCVSPHYEILDGNTLEPVWEYKIVYPCPFIKDPQHFKQINTIPNEKIPSLILNQTGPYILRSYHTYNDGYSVRTFTVVDDSFVRNTIDPCHVDYNLDANDLRKRTAPPTSISEYGRDATVLESFVFETSIGKMSPPSYMPSCYEEKSYKIKDDLNTLVYYPNDLSYDDTITITKIIQEGILFLVSDASQDSQQWSEHVSKSVKDAPDIQSSEVFKGNDVLLVHGIPSKNTSSTVKVVVDDKFIQIISTKLDTTYLMNILKSMFED